MKIFGKLDIGFFEGRGCYLFVYFYCFICVRGLMGLVGMIGRNWMWVLFWGIDLRIYFLLEKREVKVEEGSYCGEGGSFD